MHIAVMVLKPGSMARGRVVYTKTNEPNWLLTSAIYHTRETTEAIHKSYDPYVQRSTLSAWANGTDAISTGSSGILATSEVRSGGLTVSQVQLLVNAN